MVSGLDDVRVLALAAGGPVSAVADDIEIDVAAARHDEHELAPPRIEQGVGVRAVSGEKTGFAYSDQINLAALIELFGQVWVEPFMVQAHKVQHRCM